ncbi:amino acid permease [Sphaerisporangium fuscum]|uniref:amino acid permease n=1 Tax=Sphaerisporangium fuscum TaxID=2835868 RepID=UPI001BDC0889|nr:amino acid permease [Sphaerisporangium fuscum]
MTYHPCSAPAPGDGGSTDRASGPPDQGGVRGHTLGVAQGAALLVGAVLGPGVLVLPRLATASAGPASVVAWAGLLVLSVPVALTFAALGARFPGGGGVAAFTARAFGRRASAVAGWWFYFSVPAGVLAGALVGAEYVSTALESGPGGTWAVAVILLAASFGANHAGLRLSGRLQLVLTGLLAALLVVAVLAAAPHLRAANFTPFTPHGWSGVGHAAGVLFFAFVGWEAASHLSGEFGRPARDLPRATVLTLAVAGTLYLGLAVTTAGVLGGRAALSPVPLTELLERGLGPAAHPIAGVAAIFLSFGAVNTYIAGAARLGVTLAEAGALPRPLASWARTGRGLVLPAALTALTIVVTVVYSLGLDTLMRTTSACLAAVTAAGCAAATRFLTGRRRWTAVAATAFTLVVLASCGAYLVVPAIIGLLATVSRRTPSPPRHPHSATTRLTSQARP